MILFTPLSPGKYTLLSLGIESAFTDLDLGSMFTKIIVSVLVPVHKSFGFPLASTPKNSIFCLLSPKGRVNSACSLLLLLTDSFSNNFVIKEFSPKCFAKKSSLSASTKILSRIPMNTIIMPINTFANDERSSLACFACFINDFVLFTSLLYLCV